MKQRDVSVWQEERAKEFCEEWYKTQVKKDHKIVVIDDDPTGTQTVHDVPVYTAYDLEHIRKGFKVESPRLITVQVLPLSFAACAISLPNCRCSFSVSFCFKLLELVST